jgi:hypothetical protein
VIVFGFFGPDSLKKTLKNRRSHRLTGPEGGRVTQSITYLADDNAVSRLKILVLFQLRLSHLLYPAILFITFLMHSDIASDDEYDSDEPSPLKLDFKELTRRASLAVPRPCTRWRKLTKGRYHEIFVLFFGSDDNYQSETERGDFHEKEWSCIARVSRKPESIQKLLSEVQTMEYASSHSSIPVPEIYAYDFELNNNVGAQFLLMERIPGCHLYRLWDKLTLEHKKSVISDIAGILTQLSQLKFDRIGCLTSDDHVGPLLRCMGDGTGAERTLDLTVGPFQNTLQYLLSFVNTQTDGSEVFTEMETYLESYLSVHSDLASLAAPFGLIHADFDV